MAESFDSAKLDTLSGDEQIVAEAIMRFNRCAEWEAIARERFMEDLKFAHADSENGFQWPNNLLRARATEQKPCLTMNMVRQHNLNIVNAAKRNKSSVKFVGMGNGATQESANIFQQIGRHIEYQSNGQAAYETAREFQVDAGKGWVRLVTDWAGPDSFDQEIYIRRVPDPLSIYCDPDCIERDKSDAMFLFAFDVLSMEEYKQHFPQFQDVGTLQPLGVAATDSFWTIKDHVRVVEYFRKVPKKDRLISFVPEGQRQRREIRESRLHESMRKAVLDSPNARIREIEELEVEWYLIAAETIIDRTTWVGKYIPFACCVGEEGVIEGMYDCKGHTRYLKDSQRMFNYNCSASVEFGALQTKTPWIVPAKAIEEFETMWNAANRVNYSALPYNHIDDEGQPIPPPQRVEPPRAAPVFESGMANARAQMMEVSGQYQNQLGEQGNERTGKAINSRIEQSATSVYHFYDNYAQMLRFVGKQIIDLVPKVYDTKRVKRILADDGTEMDVEIDPSARQGYLEVLNHQGEVVRRIFNPSIGQYDVAADVGAAYGTRRQETLEALTLILTQAPALTSILGDLLVGSMDFDKAIEAAQRMKRLVPPAALGKGPSPQEQAMATQIQQLQGLLAKTLNEKAKDQVKLVGKGEMRDIDAYDAETKRMAALQKMLPTDPEGLRQVISQLVEESLKTTLSPVLQANQEAIATASGTTPEEQPPIPGAKKAPDGQWYLLDPTRKGKYMRVGSLAQER